VFAKERRQRLCATIMKIQVNDRINCGQCHLADRVIIFRSGTESSLFQFPFREWIGHNQICQPICFNQSVTSFCVLLLRRAWPIKIVTGADQNCFPSKTLAISYIESACLTNANSIPFFLPIRIVFDPFFLLAETLVRYVESVLTNANLFLPSAA
jgi:hypothetical protein